MSILVLVNINVSMISEVQGAGSLAHKLGGGWVACKQASRIYACPASLAHGGWAGHLAC